MPSIASDGRASAPRRVANATVAFLLGLVLLELSLRAVGWVRLRSAGERAIERQEVDGLTFLCHGDSNVFGLFVAPEETYPARLAALLEEREPGRHQIINLGFPGLDSAGLVRRLRADLDAVQPDVLLLSIGANNQWAWTGEADPPWHETLRIVKTLRVAFGRANVGEEDRVRVAGGPLDEPGGTGVARDKQHRIGPEESRLTIGRDLRAIEQMTREAGVRLVLVGYAANASIYATATDEMREVASELDLPFIKTSGLAAELVRREGFGAVFFPDMHPRQKGYQLVARAVHAELYKLNLVSGDPVKNPFRDLASGVPSPLSLHLERADLPAIEVRGGPPGAQVILYLWDLHDEPRTSTRLDAKNDELALLVREAGGTRGRFDAQGIARISLDPLLEGPGRALIGERYFYATCYVAWRGEDGRELPSPEPIELQL